MKLVERLARALLEWPHGVESITQSSVDGELYFHHADYEMTESGIYLEQADYCLDVTRAQWEAERARILAGAQPERDEFIKELVDEACGKRSQYEQDLWDKVAARRFNSHMELRIGREHASREAFYDADAFMAERAKRLKK